jgi:hypothetical protein
LRYISSTSHSFCPNGELVLLTAAIRLDSVVLQGSSKCRATLRDACDFTSAAVGQIAAP